MKGEFLTVNARLIERFQHTLREVKTGSGGSDRTFDFGIDRLVGRLVALLRFTIEVRRNGQFTYCIQEFCPGVVTIPRELNDVGSAMKPFPFTSQSHLLTIGHLNLTKEFALFPFFQIAHQAVPLHAPLLGEIQLIVVGKGWFETEHLDEGTLYAFYGCFSEMQACLDDLRVVEDHQSTCGQVFGQGGKDVLAHLTLVIDEQLAGITLCQRKLGNALVGQVVVVISNMYVLWIQNFLHFSL